MEVEFCLREKREGEKRRKKKHKMAFRNRRTLETVSRYLQENEVEYDFLPPAAVDDNMKFLDSDVIDSYYS